ncbi:MAG: NAD-dependent epimerase/dehydratase family protein [Nanoarchaeota archaeon]|nr:NAD-dependent epimerase/dehydratase family protein [Nanoarchaeota archaeon]
MKTALVCGAGGFIGGHLVKRLKSEGYWVRGADLKEHQFSKTVADDFIIGDLVNEEICKKALSLESGDKFDEVYQLAADMGGAGYIFTGENDFNVMHNSASVNLNFTNLNGRYKKIFYSSSACIYPEEIQLDTDNKGLKEGDAYPANPDSEYGWEKLFSERLYAALNRNVGSEVRIARFHNIFGPEGTWTGGKEKAPAAMCRKVAECSDGGEIEIWGDGEQTRSFLYIDECLEGIRRLMDSDFMEPVNIGSEEIISINALAEMAAEIAGKSISLKHIEGPLGVRGRTSENSLILEKLDWAPSYPLKEGMKKTYKWIAEQVEKNKGQG